MHPENAYEECHAVDKRLRNAVIAGAVIMSLVLAVVVFVPRRAEAEDPAEPRLISVNGEATVVVKPDLVTVSFGVETNGSNAKEAQQANASAMNKVIAALKNRGIGADDIQTSNFSLRPVYGWVGEQPNTTQVVTGYRCNNTVTARVKALDTVGTVIDAAVEAGATNVSSISFGLQNPEPAKNEALAAAVVNAREKAQVMADAAKVTITGIHRVSDGYATFDGIESAVRGMLADKAATPIEGGTVTVRATVRIDFSF